MKKVLFTLILALVANSLMAQDYKFGKVSKEELEEQFYAKDSSANAVILYKNRKTDFRYMQGEGFQVITEVHERIKIYNSEGYDWATKEIDLYQSSSGSGREEVAGLKAVTYNLEGGKVLKSNLEKNEIFKDEKNKYWIEEKFTMPNLKEGCIVEWKYKINSPFRSIEDVQFQYAIPVKKMNIKIETPEYFVYKKRSKGYFRAYPKVEKKHEKITINTKNRSSGDIVRTTYSSSSIDYVSTVETYDITDVPALLEEPYVNNIDNYRSMMEYEFSELHWPNEPIEYFSNTWEDVTKTIYRDSDFSDQIYKSNHFEVDLALVLASAKTEAEKITAIFELIKHKIKWNDYTGITTFNGTKKAYKEGVGNAADINLNLVSMLNSAGFNANPVIISTRSHGIPLYPTLNGFNFVIAAVELEGGLVLLDATDTYSTPNNLPLRDLNWNGRLIRKDGSSESVNLIPTEPSTESVYMMVSFDEEGEATGMYRKSYYNLNAQNYRNKKGKLKDEDIIAKIEAQNSGIEIGDFKIQNKENSYKPLVEMYKFNSESMVDKIGNKIYLNPLLFNATTVNPFKLENREYPIDFGTPISEKNNIVITIPEGYSVVSIPEVLKIGLSNNFGIYTYKVINKGNKIMVQSNLKINTAIFPAQNYQEIKEFYSLIVNKNLEKIVLEKTTTL
ncbi:protein of unknown function [Lutibacter agarilyticus]|uniref:DUF3857 domain-containing protein n=1 Tax=Lutibacter agarilyticus TaxID=1109740 RepID=A0A238WCG3_9FLAO|nr:DUF3857 domain-containing protein [Lutibacter agarilyticus]SNR44097.1 protein of unknown function [Lutibacter agarilyticus]